MEQEKIDRRKLHNYKIQSMFPEDDRMIEKCRSVLSVFLCKFYIIKDHICAFVGVLLKQTTECTVQR